MTFEQWATEKGFDLESMDEANVEALRKVFEAETVPADEPVEAEGTEKDDEKDKDKPVNAGGLSVPRRSNFGTASVGTSQSTSSAKVIEASLLMSGGIDDRQVETLGYDQRTIDQAVSAGNRGIGLQALFHRVIRASGMHYPGGMHDNDFIRTAFDASEQLQRRGIRASGIGFSTMHLPGILSNVANKRLLAAYRHVDPSCLKIAYIASNNDFKEHAYYQFEMDGALREVSPTGQLQHVGLQETEYKTKLETKGAIVSLTRHMIINDDLEAFLRIPNEYGRKTAQGLDHAFFKAMYKNVDVLFNADHNNRISGGDSILSGTGYTLATQKFSEQKDNGGGFIMATPRYVVGAPALLPTAKRLFVSQTLNETTTPNKGQPNANIWESAYEPIITPWMSEAAGLGGTDKDWMLISDPNDVAFMQVAFLKGQRNPTIESGEMDFSVLGMSWRCFYDFGIGLMNPQGAVYSEGA